jgi:hypothetical protein
MRHPSQAFSFSFFLAFGLLGVSKGSDRAAGSSAIIKVLLDQGVAFYFLGAGFPVL